MPPHVALIRVTLNPPSPKIIFSNQQAELKCEVSGQDSSVLSDTEIYWSVDGNLVTDNIRAESRGQTRSSVLTRNLTDWNTVKKVSCSAVRKDMTPVTDVLALQPGMLLN